MDIGSYCASSVYFLQKTVGSDRIEEATNEEVVVEEAAEEATDEATEEEATEEEATEEEATEEANILTSIY